MSHSILRRYTPPTCTLEITAKHSPLSRWAGQPVVKQLRFQLSLDDPKLPKEQWVTLRGDRAQLDHLHAVVSSYVQSFLEQTHSLGQPSRHANGAMPSSSETAIAVLPSNPALATASSAPGDLSLQPRGLLTHDLFLGTLAAPETDTVVPLSALQLFDLANALDDYAGDLVALPELQRSRQSNPATLRWGQLAAISLVVVGLSASVAKLIDNNLKTASPTASQGASSSDQQIATQVPPSATQSPYPAAASGQKLPPPPPLGSTLPVSPGLPTVSLPSPAINSPKTGNPSGQTSTSTSPASPGRARQDAGNQIALRPQSGMPSAATRSQAAKPVPNPLSLKREFANAPPSQSSSAGMRSSASDRSAQAEQTGTAFDTIPQVAEARRYFQQRWNPPQGLTQTLEYTLLVGANGSIQRTVPLGQAAGDYVDRAGIPLTGEPFVSALNRGQNAKIRLVLSPDGSVKTFLEGSY
ncbi:DUF4335 domain-containing protein [Stenomitos frigidus]|uniref:DUF4335 domain-containing protein n=1 Tax=Stenomitos frigidus ULC18 TaxID=2107698 RepID=A0A2T1DT63_9CYAN|nr:DUF4335 domain-containing protein [Stenomitos frigidus]PSB23706.1 hypothetical protein C7B82_29685 [Stenomitos frigidus ULC18]